MVTQLKEFLRKPGENIRVVYIQGFTGRPGPELIGTVFVRVKAGQLRVIGLGQADSPRTAPKKNTPPEI